MAHRKKVHHVHPGDTIHVHSKAGSERKNIKEATEAKGRKKVSEKAEGEKVGKKGMKMPPTKKMPPMPIRGMPGTL